MNCANCHKDAHYIYKLTKKVGLYYCDEHLPSFLYERRRAGLLETTDHLQAGLKEVADKLSPKPVKTETLGTSKRKSSE